MPSFFGQVKSIVSTIRGAGTTNIVGDLDKKIDTLNTSDALDPNRRSSFIDLMRDTLYTSNRVSNRDVIYDLSRDLSEANVSQKRIEMYDEMMKIFRYVPILSKAANIYVSEILAPDPSTKMAIKVTAEVDVNTDTSKYTTIIDEYKDILKKTKIDDKIQKILFDTLVLGDQFVEISTVEDDFRTAVASNGLVLKDSLTETIYDNKKNPINLYIFDTPSILENEEPSDGISYVMEDHYPLMLAGGPNDNTNHGKPITAKSIKLFYHNPRNIVIVRQGKWVLGYLYVDKIEQQYRDTVFRDEKPIGDIMIEKLVKAVQIYLKNKVSADIPDELKDTITNVLNNNMNRRDLFVRFIPEENMQHFKHQSIEFDPYGESYFFNMLPILRMYIARLTSSTIYRITRAGKHMLVDVDTTNTRDARGRIEEVKRAIKMREVVGSDFNSIDKVLSHISTFQDIYVASKDGKRLINIDTFDMGGYGDRSDEDSTLLKNILTGLEIPPSYLGIEEFATNRNTLSQESIVFARSILRLQGMFTKQLTSMMKKIYNIIYKNRKYDPNFEDVVVTFSPPQDIMLAAKEESYTHAKNLIETLAELGFPKDKARKMFIPDIDWDKNTIETFGDEDQQNGGMGGDMMGMGGGADMGFGGGEMSGMDMGGGDFGGAMNGDDMNALGGEGGLDMSAGGAEMGGEAGGMGGNANMGNFGM